MELAGWGVEGQKRVGRATVFIAGLGGLGSIVSSYLVSAGVGHLQICDSGKVETSNLNRQILYCEKDIGQSKAFLASRRLSEMNSGVGITAYESSVSESTVEGLARGADVIVDCLDHWEGKSVLNAYAVFRSLPLVHGGVNGLSGQVSFIHTPVTPCLSCIVKAESEGSFFPVAGPAAGLIGCLQSLEVLKYLTGIGKVLKNTMLFWDGEEMAFSRVNLKKDPACPVCGQSGG